MSQSTRLRILMISPTPILPMNAGERVRIWHIAHGLARHCELTLVVPVDQSLGLSGAQPLANAPFRAVEVPWFPPGRPQQLQSLASTWPYHVALYYRKNIEQRVNRLLAAEQYDLIYCHFMLTLPYGVARGVPVIWDQHNVDRVYWQHKVAFYPEHSWRQLIARWNLAKVLRMEQQLLPKVAGIVSVSQVDQSITGQLLPAATPCFVAPNGVDTDHYGFAARRPGQLAETTTARQPLVLGFLGSLNLELNQMAVRTLLQQILPSVIAHLPERAVSLLIVGRDPPQWLHELVAQSPYPWITLTGTVADVRPYLHQMDLLVLPLQSGAGTKLRVVEAMATGVCVVGSEFALMGLAGAVVGQHCCLAQSPAQFVAVICELARNPLAREQMVLYARQLVEARYRWQQITAHLATQLERTFGVAP